MRDYVCGLREHVPADPTQFLHALIAYIGGGLTPPDRLPSTLLQNAHMLRHERPPDEARIPLAALREAPFPKLVVSGGHSRVFDADCDVPERELGAERAVVPGAGHSVRRTGTPCSEVLHCFLSGQDSAPDRVEERGARVITCLNGCERCRHRAKGVPQGGRVRPRGGGAVRGRRTGTRAARADSA